MNDDKDGILDKQNLSQDNTKSQNLSIHENLLNEENCKNIKGNDIV